VDDEESEPVDDEESEPSVDEDSELSVVMVVWTDDKMEEKSEPSVVMVVTNIVVVYDTEQMPELEMALADTELVSNPSLVAAPDEADERAEELPVDREAADDAED
jgi:hypothetical protein